MQTYNSDLTFNVAQLLKESVGSTRKHTFETPHLLLSEGDESVVGEGKLEASDVQGQIKVTKVSDGLLVQGDVEADVALECSRCVDRFSLHVDAALEEQFQPVVDVETGRTIQRADNDGDEDTFNLDQNHMMELTEPVRQALLVALPMKPLHSEDCKGICLTCGANLNEVDCGHGEEPVDNRWTGLRELRIEDFPAGDNVN